MPKRGNRRVKRRTHVPEESASSSLKQPLSAKAAARTVLAPVRAKDAERLAAKHERLAAVAAAGKVPSSIVVRHGKTGKHLSELVEDLRRVMSPHTAAKLKERRKASIKDYTAVAGPLGVTHLMVVSQASKTPTLKIARLPVGPTLSFRVRAYALHRQIRAAQRKSYDSTQALQAPPLVVLNNFDEARLSARRHLKIVSLAFQSMFPAINVRTVRLGACRRVLLLHLNDEDDTVEFRHYLIRTKRRGVSKPIRRIIRSSVPDLGKAADIGDLLDVLQGGYATSDSEFEDEEACIDMDPNAGAGVGRANSKRQERIARKRKGDAAAAAAAGSSATADAGAAKAKKANQSVVQLSEIGPRMTLELVKVEDGVFDGEVQYHAHESRSKDQVLRLRKTHNEKRKLKEDRRSEQEANVQRKRKLEQEKAERKKLKRAKRAEADADADEDEDDDDDDEDDDEGDDEGDEGEDMDDEEDEGEAEEEQEELGEADEAEEDDAMVEAVSDEEAGSDDDEEGAQVDDEDDEGEEGEEAKAKK